MAFGSLDRLLVMAHLVISRRHQLRRFGREVDIGFGGCASAARLLRDARAVPASCREVPRENRWSGRAPDDSADSTGERLGSRDQVAEGAANES